MKRLTAFCCFSFYYFIIFCPFDGASQQRLYYDQFTSEKGLSENVVYGVLQDKRGFIWAGTHHGLNRFDGYSFKKIYSDKNDSTSLSQNEIYIIKKDAEGKIWIGAEWGANYFDPQTEKSRRIEFEYNGARIRTSDLHILNKDSLLILSNGSVFLYTLKQNSCIPVKVPLLSSTASTFIVFADNSVGIDALDEKEVLIYNKATNGFEFSKNIPGTAILPVHPVLNYFFDGRGNHFLFSPFTSIEVYNEQGKLLSSFDAKKFPGMPFVIDCSFSVAESGIVYIGTTSGLVLYDPRINDFVIVELFGDSQSLKGNKEIRSVCIDKDQNLWLGIFGEGLLKCQIRQFPFSSISLDHLAPKNVQRMIFALYLWPGDEVAAATGLKDFAIIRDRKVASYTNTEKMGMAEIVLKTTGKNLADLTLVQYGIVKKLYSSNELVSNQFLLHDSVTILRTDGSLKVVREDTSFAVGNAYTTFVMDDGSFYWAPTTVGLLRVNKKDFSDTMYTHEPGNAYSLNENYAYHLIKDEDTNLWIGTKGGGLNFFNRSENRFYHYTTKDGLPDDVIYVILPDRRGNLWLTTNNGLSKFNIRTKTFVNYSRRDGLLNSEFNRNGGIMTGDGTFYFSGTNGIDFFDPDDLEGPRDKPGVFFSGLSINGKEISLNRAASLKHFENNITISFTANDFTRPDLVYYRYRLRNEDEWTRVQGTNSIVYNTLPEGKYSFTVQSSYDNLNWSDAAVHSFVIRTPWWKTNWFYFLLAIVVSAILYAFYRYRINQLKKVLDLRSRISQDLHDEVGATLSSIHVYSSVASLALDKDPAKAKDALQHINTNTRQVMENMNDIVWAINTGQIGEATLEGKLKNYGYELLTPINIHCSYRIDKDADKKIGSIEARKNILLIAKEAMNNIAKYSHASSATVSLLLDHKNLHIEITDDGEGFDAGKKRNGNGLNNMRQRAEALGGNFTCLTKKDAGTKISCYIPLTSISD